MGNLIIGALFIIGGVSGHFVMRGTNSTWALAALGGVLVLVGIVQLSRSPAAPTATRRSGGGTTRRTGRAGNVTGRERPQAGASRRRLRRAG